ncbi:hypothetical protein HDZ31DRAFT_69214 [Schizophyllum fasciatum]
MRPLARSEPPRRVLPATRDRSRGSAEVGRHVTVNFPRHGPVRGADNANPQRRQTLAGFGDEDPPPQPWPASRAQSRPSTSSSRPSAPQTRPRRANAPATRSRARKRKRSPSPAPGGRGSGNTSLLPLLLETADVSPAATADQRAAPARFLRGPRPPTPAIATACVEIPDSPAHRLLLSAIDTPGLDFSPGRELALARQVAALVKYLEAQYTDTISEVRGQEGVVSQGLITTSTRYSHYADAANTSRAGTSVSFVAFHGLAVHLANDDNNSNHADTSTLLLPTPSLLDALAIMQNAAGQTVGTLRHELMDFRPTPLAAMHTAGMDNAQVWEQFDLRGRQLCAMLEYSLEGETERIQDLRDAPSDASDTSDTEPDALAHIQRAPTRPSRPPARRARGHPKLDDGFFDLAVFKAETEAAEARCVSRGRLDDEDGSDEDGDDMSVDLFAPVEAIAPLDGARALGGVDEEEEPEPYYKDFFEPPKKAPGNGKNKDQAKTPRSSKTGGVRFHDEVWVKSIKRRGRGLPVNYDPEGDGGEDGDEDGDYDAGGLEASENNEEEEEDDEYHENEDEAESRGGARATLGRTFSNVEPNAQDEAAPHHLLVRVVPARQRILP